MQQLHSIRSRNRKTEQFLKKGESSKQCHGIMTKDMNFVFQSEMQTLEADSFSKNANGWLYKTVTCLISHF